MQRLKIPTTCSLLAPTCLYSCDRWVMAAQPRNMHQKCQVSHAHGLGCVLYAFGSQAREDSEHAKFKVNSGETSEATSCCWELPCYFFLFVPILHGLLLTGWRLPYTTATAGFISRHGDRARNSKASVRLLHKDLVPGREKTPPTLSSHTKTPKITVLPFIISSVWWETTGHLQDWNLWFQAPSVDCFCSSHKLHR